MRATMSLITQVRCPADEALIPYDVVVEITYRELSPEKFLMAEALSSLVALAASAPAFQERITAKIWTSIHSELERDGIQVETLSVGTTATHSGVKLTCEV